MGASIVIRPSIVLAAACLLLHCLANGQYGFFRDELYFIVCGDHPDWGYVDQPPLIPLLASWSHTAFGDFLWGFRLLPAMVMSATVALAAEFARLIGGGRFSQWLAGLCVLLGPMFLLEGVVVTTDLFQPLTWLGLAWLLVKLEETRDERWWLAFGAIAGFSFETKYLVVFFLAALGLGLMATPQRASLRRPWLYLGALAALLTVAPNLLWQQAHGWPFLELGKAASGGKNLALSPLAFLLQQSVVTGPAQTVVWLCGLWACLARPKLNVARAFSVVWLVLLLTFDATHGKPYYLAPIYPILLAFGAVRIEGWTRAPAGRGLALAVVAVTGAVLTPLTLPILPVRQFVRYQQAIGFMPSTGERLKLAMLPQYYADMFGWPEMADKVAAVYRALPSEDRARAVFFGDNYGEAAAIDVFGRRLGLPPAISGHNNYWIWGPREHDGSVVIIIGGKPERYAELFRSVQVVGRTDAAYAIPYETGKPIYVLRGMKTPLGDYWPRTKSFE